MRDLNEFASTPAPRGSLRSLALALAVLIAATFWIWSQGAERRALRGLPADERAALFARTLATIRTDCATSDLALDAYCRDQARILLEFPECARIGRRAS